MHPAKTFIKLVLGLVLGLAVAALTAFNILLAWVATGPRSLEALSPYIEMAFEPPDHSYSVHVGETWMVWDGWKHPIDMRLRDVKVTTNERHTYSHFSEISLGLDLAGLLTGHIWPTSLTINHPVIGLFENDDRSVSFGLEPEVPAADAAEPPAVPFAAIMAPFISPDESGALHRLRLISIVNADLTVSNKSKGVFFKTSGADFTFKRNRDGLHAFAGAKIAYDNYQSLLSAQFVRKNGSPVITGEVTFSQLMPGTLADLFADTSLLSAMHFPASGKVALVADTEGGLQKAEFVIDGGRGSFDSDWLEASLPLEKLHVEGQLDQSDGGKTRHLEIAQFNADLGGPVLEGAGTLALKDNDPEIHAKLSTRNIAAGDVHLFWPPKLAPLSREWVTSNVTDGKVVSAQVAINIAPGDIAKPVLPKEDIDALVELQGAKVRYLPEHPELTELSGKVHIDGMSLDAAIDSAHFMKDTQLSEGRVLIADLNPDNPYIKVSLTADSTARDAIHLLSLPPIKHAQHLNLLADEAQGKIKAQGTLGFTFFAPKDGEADIDYEVKAELAGMSQAGFMKKFDGKNVNGTLAVDNKGLKFKGGGEVNGASVSDATVKYLFRPEQGFDTFIDATATAPVESLPRFGYPAFEFLQGTLGVKASVKEGKGVESTQAAIDLTDASINMASLHISKPDKEPASLTLTADKKEDVASISAFHYKGRDTQAQGSAELTHDLSGLRHVSMDKLVLNGTDLESFEYERTADGYIISMKGDTLDVSPWMGSKSDEESNFSFAHFPALQLKADVSHVVFDEGRELRNVKGSVDCDAARCEKANIAGVTPDGKPFNFLILRNPKGKRQLSLHVQSAGQFLRAVNMFDGMEGGDLTVTGNYTEATATGPGILRARADINEHTVKNASVLAKILSSASFTGIFDTLQGNGIHFTRLSAPFTITGDVITLENAKTHGDALGMTAEGTVTFPKVALDIQGTIVPSYTLNHVLGNVPILGKMLIGGEGQGVFAARYTVQGTQKDPNISVNPLSILTPGFLRGLFDILDGPAKKPEDEEE